MEIIGAVLAIGYLILEIKQNWLMWIVGIISSVFYVYIFSKAGLYAEMGLNVYYVLMSGYGIYCWKFSKSKYEKELPIVKANKTHLIWLIIITIIAFALINIILKSYTDSLVPDADAAIAALSIAATWMTARKIIEHWYVWIFTNAFSVGLCVYLTMYPTAILFVVYTVMAAFGLVEWEKSLKKSRL